MVAESVPHLRELKRRLLESPLRDKTVCLLFYGSAKHREDFHTYSDYDLHLLVQKVDRETLEQIREVFASVSGLDLSIHELSEVERDGQIVFQNGTQGSYFIHVLANAEEVFGTNIYRELVDRLNPDETRRSIVFKLKEYLWRIRKMHVEGDRIDQFQKYATRIIQDLLIYQGSITSENIHRYCKRQIVNMYLDQLGEKLTVGEIRTLSEVVNLTSINSPDVAKLISLLGTLIHSTIYASTD